MIASICLVGTTSCGKSTIGNLLSGRYLLPTGVQETTSQPIAVCHDSAARSVSISFSNLRREPFDETQEFVDDAKIRSCIEKAMSQGTRTQEASINLHLTLRVKKPRWFQTLRNKRLSVPVLHGIGVQQGFRICDLPGFQHSNDVGRLSFIERYIDPGGIILYAFNAEETDSTKEDKLLGGLFDLLGRKDQSWKSITFVLNRKDAFFRDSDPRGSLQSVLSARLGRIKRLITKTWPEQSDQTPEIIPLAAGPAFASEMLFGNLNGLTALERRLLEQQIENTALPLLPEDVRNLLHRSSKQWTEKQWYLVHKSMRAVSGLDELMGALCRQAERIRLAQRNVRKV